MSPAKVKSTLRHGALAVAVREYADGRFGFDFKPAGKYRQKIRLTTLDAAEEKARELLGLAQAGKVQRMEIDPVEYAEFLQWKASRKEPAKIAKLVPEFIALKKSKVLNWKTISELESTLLDFSERFPGAIGDLASPDVEAWLDARKVGPRRWNNMRAAIVGLHRYARRCRLLPAEATPVELIEKKRVKVKVQTYSPAEMRALLSVVPDEWRPLVVLGGFAGIRPEELSPEFAADETKPRLQWENILWHKDKIDVPEEVAKDRRRRFVPFNDALRALLAPWKEKRGPVAPYYLHRYTKKWGQEAGCGWKSDGLRHSYASYRLAITKDMPALSLEMGNSITMIHRHYLDLKHEDEAREWFAIGSKSSKAPHRAGHETPLGMVTL